MSLTVDQPLEPATRRHDLDSGSVARRQRQPVDLPSRPSAHHEETQITRSPGASTTLDDRRRPKRERPPAIPFPLLLAITLALVAALVVDSVPVFSGVAVALLATVGSGLSLALAALPARTSRLAVTAWSVPVGVAVSSISVQPLLWTGNYTVSSLPIALGCGAVLAHYAVAGVVRERSQALAPVSFSLPRTDPTDPPSTAERLASAGFVAAAVMAVVAARQLGPDDPDGLGFVRVLPWYYWAATALAAAGTLAMLTAARKKRHWMVPAVWIAILHLAPHAAQSRPRFPTGWLHLGFGDYLVREGGGGVGFDARFAWPGLFALVGAPLELLPGLAFDALLRWWPVVIMAYLAALTWRIGELAYPNVPSIGVVSSTLFVVLNWTGQDYLSPQSVGIVLQLMILVIVERAVRPRAGLGHRLPIARQLILPVTRAGRTVSGARLRKTFRTGAVSAEPTEPTKVHALVAVVLAAGMVMVHPLSPVFLGFALLVLAIYGRPLAWPLMVASGAIFLCWFVLTAEPWWSTQVRGMLEQITDPLGNLGSSSSGRVLVPTDDRLVITTTRTRFGLGVIGMIFAFALSNFIRPSLRPRLPLAPLAAAAIGVTALQSYGGEMAIRAYLFAVPFVSVMVGRWLLALPRPTRAFAVSGVVTVLVVPFLLARFGNETFELTSDGDRAAIEVAYELFEDDGPSDRPTSGLVSAVFVAPFGERFIGDVPIMHVDVESPTQFNTDARAAGAQMGLDHLVAVFTESDRRFRIQTESMSEDWNERFVDELIADGWESRYDEAGRFVLELDLP